MINFDAPEDRDSYVHRVGRTGRAGRRGIGISFVLADQAKEVRRMAHDLGLSREFGSVAGDEPTGRGTARPSARRSSNRDRGKDSTGADVAVPKRKPDDDRRHAARRWTCEGCGVSVGRIDGESVPAARELGQQRRRRSSASPAGAPARETALWMSIPSGSTIEDRAEPGVRG